MLLALGLHIAVLRDELSMQGVRFISSSNFYSLTRFWRAGWQLTPAKVPDLIHPIHDFDPLHGAPAGHEGARECCIREADREGIIHYASCARWGRGPPISTTVRVQLCVYLSKPVAQPFGRNADPNPHREPMFGFANVVELSVLREAEVCEGTGHKNAQPTHPERNA